MKFKYIKGLQRRYSVSECGVVRRNKSTYLDPTGKPRKVSPKIVKPFLNGDGEQCVNLRTSAADNRFQVTKVSDLIKKTWHPEPAPAPVSVSTSAPISLRQLIRTAFKHGVQYGRLEKAGISLDEAFERALLS